jgi:magnesium chelatase family protein
MAFEEALEVSAIHSVAGTLPAGVGLLDERPFRAPHHTISDVALVGGGSHPRPGEISLAHRGVLFLDEMPEFDRRVLNVLRQPLEEGSVVVARASRTVRFPARFLLVGAMNPCPCGFLGHPRRACRCTPEQISRYSGRLSGPLRDRLDLVVEVPAVATASLWSTVPGESSAAVRERVLAARTRQVARHQLRGGDGRLNADLEGADLHSSCSLGAPAMRLLSDAATRLALSARSYDRVIRVSRTIADLAGSAAVDTTHLAEALQFRALQDA